METYIEPLLNEEDLNIETLEDFPSYVTLREAVFQTLRKAILNGSLKPGQVLSENKIAAKLSVSRTPIREALRSLETESLVTTLPGRKIIVSIPTVQDIEDIFEIRLIMETQALQRIKPDNTILINKLEECIKLSEPHLQDVNIQELGKKNTKFHLTIISSLENKRIWKFMDSLNETSSRFRLYTLKDKETMEQYVEEHSQIISFLKKGDADGAINVLRNHLLTAKELLIAMYPNIEDTNKKS